MNYRKHYIKLMRKAQERTLPPDTYVERHHVFPKSIFGKNKFLVKLTAREHYVAHHLLFNYFRKKCGECHQKTSMMGNAFWLMSHRFNYPISSRVYASVREVVAKNSATRNLGKTHTVSEQSKNKMSIGQKTRFLSPDEKKKLSRASELGALATVGRPVDQKIINKRVFSRTGSSPDRIMKEISNIVCKEKDLGYIMSDRSISLALSARAITVTPCTVTSYRKKLGIPIAIERSKILGIPIPTLKRSDLTNKECGRRKLEREAKRTSFITNLVKGIIDTETYDQMLTDVKISKLLQEYEIFISHEAVRCYRGRLDIPNGKERKFLYLERTYSN